MSKFFINRPIVAMVISILTVIIGLVVISGLPVALFPAIAPPEIQISATYVGADAQTIEQSVATPIEQQMSGVDNMNYMYSLNATANGQMRMTVDFDVATDPNTDLILAQSRETQAASQLPVDVNNYGVIVQKSVLAPLMLIALYSPKGTYDARFLANYAYINLNDQLTRVKGIGNVQVFGAGQYAMRLWVKPDQLAKLEITVPEIVAAIQTQNTVNPAGQVGSEPVPKGQEFTYSVRAQGRLTSPEEFEQIVVRESPEGGIVRVKDVARVAQAWGSRAPRSFLISRPRAASNSTGSPATALLAVPQALISDQNRNFGEASLGLLSFEVDLWGRLRRATEASRASLLSADENRKAVVTTLVSDIATAYLSLRELNYELEISRRTLQTRQDSLELTKQRQRGGVSTLLDLRQAEQLVDTAAQAIPGIEQQIAQTENQIRLLLGDNPGEVVRGQSLTAQALPPEVPAGLTSELLERRPDIRAAEQDLIAANAEIGVARAAYFPQLSLSGFLGGQSTQLLSLFSGAHSAWSFVPQLSQPIFTAGRLKSGVKLTEAERDSAVARYQKTIQTAFFEVSNGLIAHQRVRESREKQEELVVALQDRLRLAYIRYRGGVDTQLNALDADRDLFQAELTLSQIRLQELLTVVQLYKALGGGWQ